MSTKLSLCAALAAILLCAGATSAQESPDDPFGGGFSMNYSAELVTMGPQGDSLQACMFDWLSGLDSILMVGESGLAESYLCGEIRDMAAADFDGDYIDEVVVAWNRTDGGVFIGIPTIDPATMSIDPGGWYTPGPPCAAGVLYANESLSDVLGEIRVVAGNFYPDPAMEFVLAYLADDSTVTLTVFDIDSLVPPTPLEKGSISDQSVNTDVPEAHRFGAVSRFDVATGDFDGDGLDEIVLVVNDPDQSPATDLMVDIYDYDTSSHAIVPISKIPETVNSDADHALLRRILVSSGNFDPDSLDEISVVDGWARTDVDSSRISFARVLKLDGSIMSISYDQESPLPSCTWNPVGVADPVGAFVYVLTTYNGDLIAGGQFTSASGVSANNIARWNGKCWKPLGSGTNGMVRALTVHNGNLIVGGYFTEAGGVSASHIAKWDGSTWEPLGPANGGVLALMSSMEYGDLWVGGEFTTIGGVAANRIARWNGSSWQPVGSGTNNAVAAFFDLGTLVYIGGVFTYAGGVSANHFAEWLEGTWSNGGTSGVNGNIWELTYSGSWALWACGEFTSAGGESCNHIASWSGLPSWQPFGSGMNGNVYAMAIYQNRLHAGGTFSQAGGSGASNIATWTGDPPDWYPLGSGVTHPTETPSVNDLYQYGSDLIAAGHFTTAGDVNVNNIARWNGTEWKAIQPRKYLPSDLKAGNLLADSDLDDIVITGCRDSSGIIEQYIQVYRVDTMAYPPELCLIWDTTISSVPGSAEELSRGRRFITTGNFTGDGHSDVVFLVNDTGVSRIHVYEPYPDTSSTCDMDSVILRGSWAITADNISELVLADIDTCTVTIGPPRVYHVDSVIQPLVIVNAPPVHYDILDDTTWDVSNRYPLPPDEDYDTYVEYYNSTGFVITTETEMHRDWGVSVGLETWASAGGFNVSAYLETSYGEGFSQQGGYSEQITIGATITARDDDQVDAVRVSYDVLEYPVIRAGEMMGHVAVASPSQTSQGWSPGEGYRSFVPNHEVDNILSYPRPEDIEDNPMMASDVIGDASDYYTMQAATTNQWFLGHQVFQNSSVTESWDASVASGGSFGYEGGFSIFGIGFSAGFEVSLDAEYSVGQLSTFSTSFAETDSLNVRMGYINSAGEESGNRKYEVTPYAYWAKNGALVIDYAVSPIMNAQGEPPTWWQLHYSQPDPAFLLPRHFDNEKYGVNDPDDSRYRTKEIVFIPDYPAPGDSVLISARVHNFSLVPTPGQVEVSFYLGNPENHGQLLYDKNSGDSIFVARDTSGAPILIQAQRDAIAEMVWQVPDASSISGCQRIWALIDPLDSITPEVHDNGDWPTNNKGWKLLYVNTDDICIDSDGDGWADPAFRCNICPHEFDNCPTVYNPDQTDSDGNGIGDACEASCCMGSMRGNVDYDGGDAIDISDLVYLVDYMFTGGQAPVCAEEANVDGSCCAGGSYETLADIDISDLVYLVDYMFNQGPEPVACP